MGMAKRLPAARGGPAQIVRLSEVKAQLADCGEVVEAELIESKAKVLLTWALEQRSALRSATLEEATEALEEADRLAREASVAVILAKARQGELLPPKAKAGRTEIVPARVRFKPNELVRLRRLAALAPKHLDDYLGSCTELGRLATPRGLLTWVKAQERAKREAEEAARVRAEVVEEHQGGRAWGERDPALLDDPTGQDPYQRAADQLAQVLRRLEAGTRRLDDPGLWQRGREQLLERIKDVAGRAAQFARDRRESLS